MKGMDENENYHISDHFSEQDPEMWIDDPDVTQDPNEIGMEVYLKLRDYCYQKAIPFFRHPRGSNLFIKWFNQLD